MLKPGTWKKKFEITQKIHLYDLLESLLLLEETERIVETSELTSESRSECLATLASWIFSSCGSDNECVRMG
jgi:hypothetical protein